MKRTTPTIEELLKRKKLIEINVISHNSHMKPYVANMTAPQLLAFVHPDDRECLIEMYNKTV